MKANLALLLLLPFFSACAIQQNISRALAQKPSPLYQNGKNFTVYSAEGFISLRGNECAELLETATALAYWQKRESKSECNCREGSCELDITALLPVWLKERLGTTALQPNCFNTALVAAGLESDFHFTKFFEFSQTLRKKCAPVNTPWPGDLGVVSLKGEGLSPVHAFLFLTKEFGFEKPGSNPQEPWRFMNPARIIGSPSPYSYDSSELQYYRCQN